MMTVTNSNDVGEPRNADEWSEWLLHHRYGGDAECQRRTDAVVAGYADKVLDACQLRAGMTLADIGSGDGVVAFRAIERVGPGLRAVLTDISVPMLEHAQRIALERGIADRCNFLKASADDLGAIAAASVDVVTTRAALAYVSNKAAALREFFRVLKPGGRLSMCEPVYQDDALDNISLKRVAEERGANPGYELLVLLHRWKAAQLPDTLEALMSNPLSNYTERDLFRFLQDSGFKDIHVELHIDSRKAPGRTWECFLQTSLHLWAPTNGALLKERFSDEERKLLENLMRPTVESGGDDAVERLVYVNATKPGPSGPSTLTLNKQ